MLLELESEVAAVSSASFTYLERVDFLAALFRSELAVQALKRLGQLAAASGGLCARSPNA